MAPHTAHRHAPHVNHHTPEALLKRLEAELASCALPYSAISRNAKVLLHSVQPWHGGPLATALEEAEVALDNIHPEVPSPAPKSQIFARLQARLVREQPTSRIHVDAAANLFRDIQMELEGLESGTHSIGVVERKRSVELTIDALQLDKVLARGLEVTSMVSHAIIRVHGADDASGRTAEALSGRLRGLTKFSQRIGDLGRLATAHASACSAAVHGRTQLLRQIKMAVDKSLQVVDAARSQPRTGDRSFDEKAQGSALAALEAARTECLHQLQLEKQLALAADSLASLLSQERSGAAARQAN